MPVPRRHSLSSFTISLGVFVVLTVLIFATLCFGLLCWWNTRNRKQHRPKIVKIEQKRQKVDRCRRCRCPLSSFGTSSCTCKTKTNEFHSASPESGDKVKKEMSKEKLNNVKGEEKKEVDPLKSDDWAAIKDILSSEDGATAEPGLSPAKKTMSKTEPDERPTVPSDSMPSPQNEASTDKTKTRTSELLKDW
ncbi:hypothetical protein QR680_009894 [Steinernema hermaphroditum]|uniref:Uncharacterized protein n=1 Tax=Steinernema hermaphroditum TaxID=289476 RepID=A0AA39IPH9_9BILA|nr:hypothetical protein QR680_009894 [Steinernema hermaphroditum]